MRAIALGTLFCASTSSAANGEVDFATMSLEELLSVEVTSVSKQPQLLSETASAVYVLTQDDIRRSGKTSVPDLLRLVPGLNVARYSSSRWAVSSRADNSIFSTDLLVMIDGRSVYTPLFGGTYWDIQHVTLEDIERIEVIRGPGGAIWGANAVNGIINIIRKPAKDQTDDFISVAAGNEDRALGSFRTTRHFDNKHVRLSANYGSHDDTYSPVRGDGDDEWAIGMASLAYDWDVTPKDAITFQADWYTGQVGARQRLDNAGSLATGAGELITAENAPVRGGNAMFRWGHEFSESSRSQLQLYWDRRTRGIDILEEDRHTYDVDFQHNFAAGAHALIWGGGARLQKDQLENSFNFTFRPRSNDEVNYNAFVQDEITLIPDRLKFTVGSKFSWHSYTGWELQPSARFLYTTRQDHQIWGAISRTVRTPSRAAREIQLVVVDVLQPFPGVGLPVTLTGNPEQDSEKTLTYELGFRTQPTPDTAIDIASFLWVLENGEEFLTPGSPVGFVYSNTGEAHAYGSEISGQWWPRPWVRLSGSYSFFRLGRFGPTISAPTHKFQVRSYVDLPGNLEFDSWLSYYGRTNTGPVGKDFNPRWGADVRLGWSPRENLELSLAGQNLLDAEAEEIDSFTGSGPDGPLEIERAFYLKLTWKF